LNSFGDIRQENSFNDRGNLMAFRSLSLPVKLAGVSVAAVMLSACGSVQKTKSAAGVGDDQYRDAIGVYSNPAVEDGMDPISAAAFWGTRYNTDQSNPEVAVKFSQALRKIGSIDEASTVMQKASTQFANNVDVSLEYGKVLVESGRAFEAVRYLETAAVKRPTDWKALSAYGVALDQIGEHDDARKQYDRALMMAPGAVTVLNNKGLSYALDGDLSSARATLRQAAAQNLGGGDARIRQNLALVLALSGEMREAERLARSDLPPLVADNNIQFYRQLMNQPAYWDEYAASGVDVPDFDAAPLTPTPQAPKLQEQPKEEEQKNDGAPIALFETVPVTNASATVESEEGEDEAEGEEDKEDNKDE
jgi:Flp pilus assembly protein TadD